MAEFLDADKVLQELNISETDLTKLISEGELIAFKDERTQKLRFLSSDVARLKESVKGKIYLTLEEVEKMAALSKNEIMDMVSEGKLQAFKDIKEPNVVKFKKSDVLKLIKKNGGAVGATGLVTPTAPPEASKQQTISKKEEKKKEEAPAKSKNILVEQTKIETIKLEEPPKTQPPSAELKIEELKIDIVEPSPKEKKTSPQEISEKIDVVEQPKKIDEEKKEEGLFLEPSEEISDLKIELEEQSEPLFKDEPTSTEETGVELDKLLDEGETAVKEEEEAEEEEEETIAKLKRPAPKVPVPSLEVGYEDTPLDMILILLTLAVMVVIGVFVYDSFHILERGKIVRPSNFTKEIGQQVASFMGAKDSNGNPIDLEKVLTEERKIGGKR